MYKRQVLDIEAKKAAIFLDSGQNAASETPYCRERPSRRKNGSLFGPVSYTHLDVYKRQELLWSDKVGYVWLAIGVNPVYVDTGIRIESAADLCYRCLDDVATDVLYMTGNDHALEAADPLELAEIKRRWEPYINQLPDYAYLCKDLLNGKM